MMAEPDVFCYPQLEGDPPPLPSDEPEYQRGYVAGLRTGRAETLREIVEGLRAATEREQTADI